MFKGRSTHNRHQKLQTIETPALSTLQLSLKEIQLIEDTNVINLTEKIELLSIALGHRLTGEIFSSIVYTDNTTGQKEATSGSLSTINYLLQKLPFPYYEDTVVRARRKNQKPQILTWFQVCLNKQVKSFMQNFAHELTDIEEGVLYGYPLSAIRAFAYLIEPNHTMNLESAAKKYIGAGVPSRDFADEEETYYQILWDKLKTLSEKLVIEAEGLT